MWWTETHWGKLIFLFREREEESHLSKKKMFLSLNTLLPGLMYVVMQGNIFPPSFFHLLCPVLLLCRKMWVKGLCVVRGAFHTHAQKQEEGKGWLVSYFVEFVSVLFKLILKILYMGKSTMVELKIFIIVVMCVHRSLLWSPFESVFLETWQILFPQDEFFPLNTRLLSLNYCQCLKLWFRYI